MTDKKKIVLRRGSGIDLPGKPRAISPKQWNRSLDAGEIAFSEDDSRLFIGPEVGPELPQSRRLEYPYRNIEIVAENSVEAFARMHGARMREGDNRDYYEAILTPRVGDSSPTGITYATTVISMAATGEASEPLPQPLLLKVSGEVEPNYFFTSLYDFDINRYTNNMGTVGGIQVDTLGNIYICGLLYPEATHSPAGLIKYNSTGQFLWARAISQDLAATTASGNSSFYEIILDANDNIVCIGYTGKSTTGPTENSAYSERTGICAKYDPDGNVIFTRGYVDIDTVRNLNILFTSVVLSNDAIFVIGYMETNLQGNYKNLIARLNAATGEVEWANLIEGSVGIYGESVSFDSVGNVLHMGKIGTTDLFMRKYNAANGTVLWTKSYTYQTLSKWDYEVLYTVGPDDSIYVTEAEYQYADSLIMTKFSPDGNLVWQKTTGNPDFNLEFGIANTIVTDTKIYVIVCFLADEDRMLNIIEFDLNGNYERVRYLVFSAEYQELDQLVRSYAIMKGDYFYIAFNTLTTLPDRRKGADGVVVIPVAWDGVSDLNYSNMLMVRAPAHSELMGDTTAFQEDSVDTTVSVTATNLFTTYPLTENVVPQIEYAAAMVYGSNFVDDASNPLSLPSEVFNLGANTASGGNFWVNRIFELDQDENYNDDFQPYAMCVTSDAIGNTYTSGVFYAYGKYGTPAIRYYLQKTTPTGEIEWFKDLLGTGAIDLQYTNMKVDETGIYVVNRGISVSSGYSFEMSKYSLDGATVLWHKRGNLPSVNLWSLDCALSGSEFIVNTYGSVSCYLSRFDRMTGNLISTTELVTNNGLTNGITGPLNHRYIEDGLGYYYLIFAYIVSANTHGYCITKHDKTTNAVVWQRAAYVDLPKSVRIGPNFDIGPDGIYVTASLIETVTNPNNSQDDNIYHRRLVAKYSLDGDLLNYKIYRVEMFNDITFSFGSSTMFQNSDSQQEGYWVNDRFVCLTGNVNSGHNMVDAYDANLNPIWGRVMWIPGAFTYADAEMVKSGNDSVTVCIAAEGNYSYWSHLMRLPIDGVYNLKGETEYQLYDLTYTDITNTFVLLHETVTHVTNVLSNTSFVITNRTGSSTADYNLFNELRSDI